MSDIRAQLIRHEGLKLKPYRCSAGKLTIGVGRNLEDNGISLEEALFLCDNDISRCRIECEIHFRFFRGLDRVRQNVLINMCFNLGITRLEAFKRMLAAIEEGDYETAAREMLDSRWAEQVGSRADELADYMRKGDEE